MRIVFRTILALTLVACMLTLVQAGPAQAQLDDSLTLTIYPRVAHEKVWGVVVPMGAPETVRVFNYRIFDLRGDGRDYLLLETASGQTRLLFDRVRRIDFVSYPRQYSNNTRMESTRYVVRCNIFLTDGTRIENAVVNAHWGLVEGETELGDFYLRDPFTVTSMTFDAH